MAKMRFSIAGLMGFVLIAGVGLGGLKGANVYWASGCYTLMIGVLVLAVLVAVQARGRERAYWAGFAIAGWCYCAASFGPIGGSHGTPPPIVTELLYDLLESRVHPEMPGITKIRPSASDDTPEPFDLSPYLPPGLAKPNIIYSMTNVRFLQVAHCLTALLIGMLGGYFSLWLFAVRERREAAPSAEVSPSFP